MQQKWRSSENSKHWSWNTWLLGSSSLEPETSATNVWPKRLHILSNYLPIVFYGAARPSVPFYFGFCRQGSCIRMRQRMKAFMLRQLARRIRKMGHRPLIRLVGIIQRAICTLRPPKSSRAPQLISTVTTTTSLICCFTEFWIYSVWAWSFSRSLKEEQEASFARTSAAENINPQVAQIFAYSAPCQQ